MARISAKTQRSPEGVGGQSWATSDSALAALNHGLGSDEDAAGYPTPEPLLPPAGPVAITRMQYTGVGAVPGLEAGVSLQRIHKPPEVVASENHQLCCGLYILAWLSWLLKEVHDPKKVRTGI